MSGLKKPCNCPEKVHDICVQVVESINFIVNPFVTNAPFYTPISYCPWFNIVFRDTKWDHCLIKCINKKTGQKGTKYILLNW